MRKFNKLLFLIILVGFFLRIVFIFNSPPSLYWDEVSLGYNSFSIAQNLKDEHGNLLPIQAFTAYGDYKPPLYIYLTAPFVKIFGLNYLTVRIVSILSGVALILLTYLIARQIFPKKHLYGYLAAAMVAISPWSIQLSRAAFEANLATSLSAAGTLFFLRATKNPKQYLISFLMFVLAMYTFNGTRYFLPFWIFFLVTWQFFHTKIKAIQIKYLILSLLASVIILIPIISFSLTNSGQLRFNEVNIFSDPEPVLKSNRLQAENNYSFISKIIFNRRVFYAENLIHHYLDHYSFRYLFISGDVNPRFSSQTVGQLYLIEALLLPLGLFYLYKRSKKFFIFLILWILISPIPASVARETPHALRTEHILPSFMLISSAGILFVLSLRKTLLRLILVTVITVTILIQFILFSVDYLTKYPSKFADDWQDGYRQLSSELIGIKDNYQRILVTDYYGRAYANLLYYWQYDPSEYLKTRFAESEPSGLWTVYGFSNLAFKPTVSCEDSSQADLLIGTPQNFENVPIQKVIFNSFGEAKFVMINSNDCQK